MEKKLFCLQSRRLIIIHLLPMAACARVPLSIIGRSPVASSPSPRGFVTYIVRAKRAFRDETWWRGARTDHACRSVTGWAKTQQKRE